MASQPPRLPPDASRATALERRAGFELVVTGIDLRPGEGTEAVYAEALAAEASHHGAIDNGAAQFGEIDGAGVRVDAAAGEIADEAARETVARAGGVEHVFEQ